MRRLEVYKNERQYVQAKIRMSNTAAAAAAAVTEFTSVLGIQ